jgi:ABC-type sulfate/molybdate transport systems ATPase subunit
MSTQNNTVKNLIKSYGDFQLNIPEWIIPDHGITALSGSSGSGKSSVIRVLLGLDSCPGLEWMLNGQNIASLPIAQRRLGVVFQNYELFPHLTALENIQIACYARKIPAEKMHDKINNWVKKLNLSDCILRETRVLSGGERQRVALARALIGEPQFLFLDEPFTALDVELRAEARQLVKSVLAEQKIPCLLITHDPADLKELAHTTFQIKNGKLV